MSYQIHTPAKFTNNGNVNMVLDDTTSVQKWSINSSPQYSIGSTSTPNAFEIDPATGQVQLASSIITTDLILKANGHTTSLVPNPALGANYNITLPPTSPTVAGQTLVYNGSSFIFATTFSNFQNSIVVTKNPDPLNPLQFSTIGAALSYVNSQPRSDSNRFCVYIYPGDYYESALTVPQYTYLVGESMEAVRIFPSALGYVLITHQNNTGIAFLTIKNTDPAFEAVSFINTGDYCLYHKVFFDGCARGTIISTDNLATNNTLVSFEYVSFTNATTFNAQVTDTNTGGGFGSSLSIENYISSGHSDNAISVSGLNSELRAQASTFQGDSFGTAITVSNGAKTDIRATYIDQYQIGVETENDSSTPTLLLTALVFEDCSININILNTNTIGHYDGYTEFTATVIPDAAPFFVANNDRHILTVSHKGADFTSIGAAIAWLNLLGVSDSPGPSNRFTIYVGPGIYLEDPFTIPSFVTVLGFYQTQTVISCKPTLNNSVFITASNYSALNNATFQIADGTTGNTMIQYDGDVSGTNFRIDTCTLACGSTCTNTNAISITSSNGPVIFVMTSVILEMSSPFKDYITIQDNGTNNIQYYISDLLYSPDATGVSQIDKVITVKSNFPGPIPGVFGAINDLSFGQPILLVGTGISIQGATFTLIDSSVLGGFNTAIELLGGTYATLNITGTSITRSGLYDLNIANPLAVGGINISASTSRINMASNNIGLFVTELTATGGLSFIGSVNQGNRFSQITNISTQVQQGSNIGKIDDAITNIVSGLTVSINAGEGYLMIGTYTYALPNYLKYVKWITQSITLPASTFCYLYIDNTGTLQYSLSEPNILTAIICSTVKTGVASVEFVQFVTKHADHTATLLDETVRNGIGPIFGTGCITTPGSSGMKISVSSGSYYFSVDNIVPAATSDISMLAYYTGSPDSTTIIAIPTDWDNAGVITPLIAGQWAKHTVYVIGDGTLLGGPQYYIFIYAQQVFASQIQAVNGPIPLTPSFIGLNCVSIAAIVVTFGDVTITSDRILDIRPTLSFVANSSSVTSDHNSLLNLTVGNAHPQYYRVDGTEPMAGTMDLATNQIVNAGTINGVTIQTHGSRHNPAGADPLSVGLVGDISAVGSANSAGSANSYPRSDHTHQGVHSVTVTSGTARYGDIILNPSSTVSIVDSPAGTFTFTAETIATGLLVTNGGGLNINYSAGTVCINGTFYTISNGSLLMADNSTNYVYVSPTTGLVSTSGSFPLLCTPMAIVTTVGGVITNILDRRVVFDNLDQFGVASSNVSSTSNPGILNSFARSDHTHQGIHSIKANGGSQEVGDVTLANGNVLTVTDSPAGTFSYSLNNTAVTPGTYGSSTLIPVINIDQQGRITSATTAAVTKDTLIIPMSTLTFTSTFTTPTIVSSIPWNSTLSGSYTTRTVRVWYVSSSNRDLALDIVDASLTVLGSLSIPATSSTGMYTFTFTNPGADTLLSVRMSKSLSAGVSPSLSGIDIELS